MKYLKRESYICPKFFEIGVRVKLNHSEDMDDDFKGQEGTIYDIYGGVFSGLGSRVKWMVRLDNYIHGKRDWAVSERQMEII